MLPPSRSRPHAATLPALALLALLAGTPPASAQWTQVEELPATDIFSVWANGDTVVAGADTSAWTSTDGGGTWVQSARVAAGVVAVQAARVRNGRLYVGTFGQGVFVSDNLGATWTPFNQGLVGGVANSQLFLVEFLLVGDLLYAATSGAGPWVRNLAAPGTWGHFGEALEPNQASNMNGIAHSGTRFLASAGFNGTVFFRDPGDPDWTLSWLDNIGPVPGLAALSAHWTGAGWIVGSNIGIFRSPTGESPWSFTDLGLGTLFVTWFAQRGGEVFAAFGNGGGTLITRTLDGGETWDVVDDLPFTFTYGMAMTGNTLYAARFDGLWRREVETVSVPVARTPALRLAISGAQPVRDQVRFRIELPEAGPASLVIHDLAGRTVGRLEGDWSAGPNPVTWSTRDLGPGVYFVRLRASNREAVARFVRVR